MAEPTQTDDVKPPTSISLRPPSKYVADPSQPPTTTTGEVFISPPLEWLWRTWAVTHSTLSMWRSARNVRITYKPYKPDVKPVANDNLVEYEKKSGKGGVKRVEGIERPDAKIPAAWMWRGKGLLVIASSHWEVLGWGERPLVGNAGEGVERWAVTWFAPTLFTQEGVDIYSDRKEGLSKETADEIITALKSLKDAPKVVELVEKLMQDVDISLPWKEGA
ncbi:uncharacterized protein GGS25DRAFT_209176 [Hypoxylon fragiforme]|uniref:uncharacterized protein n=1 Tax=Hypoxylon fragiforme TaxID=63214 RepID=UPI0020C6B28C|nr:uncharacterized protein GGS25DRAFT_209176 [Hypoxylon fragiforme]KAI2611756.1 hypothetical protein GGS25DRAFT_209176 [Hypoxylon fragiforme]